MGPQNLSDPTAAAASKVPVLHITKDDHVEELFLIVYRVSLQLFPVFVCPAGQNSNNINMLLR